MVVGEMADRVDLLVVGAGPGGYVAAIRAAELGREVLVVDRGAPEGGLGGSCLHVGCIPSKALIELADAHERGGRMADAGLVGGTPRVDLGRFQSWKQEIVDGLAGGIATLFTQHKIRHLTGSLRFNRANRAAVELPNGQVTFLEFTQAIIATGSRPVGLPSLPVDGDTVIDSTGALALDAVPASVAVIGGGYIGLELGTALAKLGAAVSIVEALDRLLPGIDRSLVGPVARRLEQLGVELHASTIAVRAQDRQLLVEGADGHELRLPAEKVIVATGRVPNTDELGLGALGVPVGDDGLIAVGPDRRATPTIAAIGDVTAGPALAHKASAEAIVAAEALCGEPAAFDPAAIPAVVFTDPEIASVGLSEAQAREAGFEVATSTIPLGASGRAATLGARNGFTRLVIDRGADRVLGVHVVGPHASELISEGTLAIELAASPYDLAATIHPHPTLSEGLHATAVELALTRPARLSPA